MEYLKAVINETLRLHPPVAMLLPRIFTQEAKINGYSIPARTQVIFIPERFLNSPIDCKGQNFNLIPFGSGRRGCPGIVFAIANIELALANLIKKFDWALPGRAEGEILDMMENPGVTTHRKNPLLVSNSPVYLAMIQRSKKPKALHQPLRKM
ncbi:Cytochrome P450 71D10 [Bienertia sinuspersici]